MNRLYQLKKNNSAWNFATESILEDFIWDNLEEIFDLKPLRRQYYLGSNICDILAISNSRQLVVIELKNTEDRYVVQQLTRYCHALLAEKPFGDRINYDTPVILKIISPAFHKDNLTDCSYSTLSFNLFQFSIVGNIEPTLIIQDLSDTTRIYEIAIPFCLETSKDSFREIPHPQRALTTALARCPGYDSNLILAMREKILRFDPRIQEIQIKPGHFIFGRSRTKFCADFKAVTTRSYGVSEYYPVLSLRLPISFHENYKFSRVTLPRDLFLLNADDWRDRQTSWFYRLEQKGTGRTQKVSRSWDIHGYLWFFLKREIQLEVNIDALPDALEEYCNQQGLPNAAQSNAALVEFLVEVSLRNWANQL